MLNIDSSKERFDEFELHKFYGYGGEVTIDYNRLKRLVALLNAEIGNITYYIGQEVFGSRHDCFSNALDISKVKELCNYLITYEGVPQDMLEINGEGSRMNLKTATLDRLESLDYAPNFVSLYKEYKSMQKILSQIRGIYATALPTDKVDRFGNSLGKSVFYYNRSATQRTYTNSINFQNLKKEFTNLIRSEAGKFFLCLDLKQIDLRVALNTYLRDSDNSLLVECLNEFPEDNYKGFAKYLHVKSGKEFCSDSFEDVRKFYKVGTLSAIYGENETALAEEIQNSEVAHELVSYLASHDGYQSILGKIKTAGELDNLVLTRNYFGSEREVPADKRLMNVAINTPVQGTSAEILFIALKHIILNCREAGLTEDEVKFIMNRHDELIFEVREDCIERLQPLFDCLEIQIDNWSLLKFSLSACYDYGVVEEHLMKRIEEAMGKMTFTPARPCPSQSNYVPIVVPVVLKCMSTIYGDYRFTILSNDTYSSAVVIITEQCSEEAHYNIMLESKLFKGASDITSRIFILSNIKCTPINTINGKEVYCGGFSSCKNDPNLNNFLSAIIIRYYSKRLATTITEPEILESARFDSIGGRCNIEWLI